MERGKIVANRGVARNKKPLQNLCYKVEEKPSPEGVIYFLFWGYEREMNRGLPWSFHGSVTLDEIKKRLSPNQWGKFRQGIREFTVQRRVDGHNRPLKKPAPTT